MPLWRITEKKVEVGDILDGYLVAEVKQDFSVSAKMRRFHLDHTPRHLETPMLRQMWAEEEAKALKDRPMTWARLVAPPRTIGEGSEGDAETRTRPATAP